tara:strand:- start:165 stop:500 length:336 start_codon:yes stop_codon:yes gene_type:complete
MTISETVGSAILTPTKDYEILLSIISINKNRYDPITTRRSMAGKSGKGERIPRRPLPKFEEAGTLMNALSRDGWLKTPLEDTNEFGPHSMILMLMVVATITGGILLAFRYI